MQILRDIVNSSEMEKPAFLIGNGPNLRAGIMPTWKELLSRISEPHLALELEGLSNTEAYDLVELNSFGRFTTEQIKQKVCDCLTLKPSMDLSLHKRLMDYALNIGAPVLTTNFDRALEESVGAKKFHFDSKTFTRFYPWKTYYAPQALDNPLHGFGIWKIHGDVNYRDSIRLGLSDYMGSVERARKLIHNGDERLFRGKREEYWQGNRTWLHIWFNKPIVIFGLGCNADEIFIRWLLIERKRYHLNTRMEPMKVCYISLGQPSPATRNLLLPLGVELKVIDDYEELYGL